MDDELKLLNGGRRLKRTRPSIAGTGPHVVDVHVGSRLRLARLLAGRTQTWLAQQVSLTFQQLQKYERGTNRISCSMLYEFAAALDRPIPWFFEEGPLEPTPPATIDTAIGQRQRLAYELTSNFSKIGNDRARHHLVALVRAFADIESGRDPDGEPPPP